MAIFSRRTLQRLINENASFLTKCQLKNHIDKLNNGDLSIEWEVVVLNVFNKLGGVVHEPEFENSKKKLDLFFSSENVEFVADIRAVSDKNLDKENPVYYLEERLREVKIKYNLKGAFCVEIGGNSSQAVFENKKQELYLPKKGDFHKEIFNNDFQAFIKSILEGTSDGVYRIKKQGIDIKITYSENKIIFSGFPAYKEIITLENNPIWHALRKKYDDQLNKINYEGHLGIILCDGDCKELSNKMPSWYGKSSGAVIRHFLKKKTKVSFVLTLFIAQRDWRNKPYEMKADLFVGQRFDTNLDKFFESFLQNLENLFPTPLNNATNAINLLKYSLSKTGYDGESFYGGATMSRDTIELSARTVLELLAGKIPYDEFPEDYQNYFKRKLSENKLIIASEIKKDARERDDDWLIFKFGDSDPGIAPLEIPKDK